MKKLILAIVITLNIFNLLAKPKVYVRVNNKNVRYVKVKPLAPNIIAVRPVCPGPKYVWTDGDWVWNPQTNQYVFVEGRWVLPAVGAVWIPGHWKKNKYGWHWINGHWR